MIEYSFDRFLRGPALVEWIAQLAPSHSDLVSVETYGRSFEGLDLLLVTGHGRVDGCAHHAATGDKQSTHFWCTGPTDAEGLAEVDGHVDFAVAQALAAPCVKVRHACAESVGEDTRGVVVGVANTGWLPTTVSTKARQDDLVRPVLADVVGDVEVFDGAVRRTLGQLAGSSSARFTNGAGSTPDRASCSWLVRAVPGTTVTVTVQHQRAGSDSVELALELG